MNENSQPHDMTKSEKDCRNCKNFQYHTNKMKFNDYILLTKVLQKCTIIENDELRGEAVGEKIDYIC